MVGNTQTQIRNKENHMLSVFIPIIHFEKH